jgi:hypothetical protein
MRPASTPQLTAYLRLRREGCSIATAADESGLPVDAAWEAEAAVQRGELTFTKEEDMAQTAKTETEEQDVIEVQKPDYERAIRVMENDIHPQNEKNATARGELSAGWKVIEDDCHVNKMAAKFYYKMTGMSPEKLDDVLRSLFGLMKTGNMGISADLVDRMGDGEAPTMPIVEPAAREGLATLQPELTH